METCSVLPLYYCPLYWYAVLHSWCHNLTWISCNCTVTSMWPATTLIDLFSTVDSSYAFPATYWIYQWEINNHCLNVKNNNHCLKIMTHRCQQILGGEWKNMRDKYVPEREKCPSILFVSIMAETAYMSYITHHCFTVQCQCEHCGSWYVFPVSFKQNPENTTLLWWKKNLCFNIRLVFLLNCI